MASLVDLQTPIDAGPLPFDPLEFTAASLDTAGLTDTTAGGHPSAVTTSFVFPSATTVGGSKVEFSVLPVERVKQIVIEVPPGVVADARAAATCTLSEVTNLGIDENACPAASRIGTISLFEPRKVSRLSLVNVAPERGYPVEFAAYLPALQRSVLLYGGLGPAPEYRPYVISAPADSFIEDSGVSTTLFGDPALLDGGGLSPAAFFTNPSDCSASGFTTMIHVDSWEHPARFNPDGTPDLTDPRWKSASSTAPAVSGCEALQFHPTITLSPDTSQPDAPAALNTDVKVPQNSDPNGLATPPLRDITVTLPRGLVVSPSSANGLASCSDEQFALSTASPATCPQASQIGTVTLHTPILANPVQGQVFLGAPECDPCTEAKGDPQSGRMVRLFMQVHTDEYGITVKLPGTVAVDPNTGQLTATFKNSPQQPFDDLQVHFKSGPGAAVSTPSMCGQYSSAVDLKPWSSPQTPDANLAPSFEVSGCSGVGGFAPGFLSGTVNPRAGQYSPFTLTLTRNDREQELKGFEQTLAPGLTAKLAGIPLCPDAQAAAGRCSASSQIGTVTVGAGPGSSPFYTTGKIYLTGPYNGGPFGEVVVVQAVAGPFNLGTVVVRGAIRINRTTAQASVVSDPFPTMLDGIPLQTRVVNVTLDRPEFTLNPTSCAASQIAATVTSGQNTAAPVSSPFQAVNCANLAFKPGFSASTSAKTSKANGASLSVKVTSGAGQANIAKVKVDLPIKLPSRLTTLQKACADSVFAVNPAACPAASFVGSATASTPLLANLLTGPALLVSHGGAAFPDLVIVLQGEGIVLELDGKTDIKKGITSSTFSAVPDQPITSFQLSLPQGPHSVLAAYGNFCQGNLNMPTMITGQNGAVVKQTTRIAVTSCPKVKKHARKPSHKKKKK